MSGLKKLKNLKSLCLTGHDFKSLNDIIRNDSLAMNLETLDVKTKKKFICFFIVFFFYIVFLLILFKKNVL